MSSAQYTIKDKKSNSQIIICKVDGCKCKLLPINKGQLIDYVSLPEGWPTAPTTSLLWSVGNVMTFDNIAVSKPLPNSTAKALACPDCDQGPVGFLTAEGEAYILPDQVSYLN